MTTIFNTSVGLKMSNYYYYNLYKGPPYRLANVQENFEWKYRFELRIRPNRSFEIFARQ